jgi:creatinine amidohydrolase
VAIVPPPERVRWQALRRGDVAALARAGAVAVVPIGSVEQHGDHLPLDTDSYTAAAVAHRAGEAARFPVVVAPTVWWGVSGYWMGFPGTIAISPGTLEALLVEICSSIAAHGFPRIVLLNGHAGNTGALHASCTRLAADGIRAAGVHYWQLAASELERLCTMDAGVIGHAGEIETSLQLHLRPDAVGPLPSEGHGTRMPRSVLPPTFAGVAMMPPDPPSESPTGVYGDPSVASAELGARALDAIVERLVELLAAFRETPLPTARNAHAR